MAAILFVMGGAAGLTNVHITSWCQRRVEPTLRGRVMSVLMLGAVGLLPVSLVVAGVLAQWNVKLMFLFAGVATLTVTALVAMQRSVREIV
jgi:MFS family permease